MNLRATPIEEGTWYYCTVDLDFDGFASFIFQRFVEADDRTAVLVRFNEPKYFSSQTLLLFPSSTDPDFFRAGEDEILTVWTFDGTAIGTKSTVDLKPHWPQGILDKAAITPSLKTAQQWTINR